MYDDKSGDNLSLLISEKNIINNSLVAVRQCVPDEEDKIIVSVDSIIIFFFLISFQVT